MKSISLSSFQIKLFALIFMTLDHVNEFIFHSSIAIFTVLGRIAAPLFLYTFVISLKKTNNKLMFLHRLFFSNISMCAAIAVANFIVYKFGFFHSTLGYNNIFSTFFVIGAVILCLDKFLFNLNSGSFCYAIQCALLLATIIGIPCIVLYNIYNFSPLLNLLEHYQINGSVFSANLFQIIITIIPNIISMEYSYPFLFLAILWYFFDNKYAQILLLVIFSILSYLGSIFSFTYLLGAGDFFISTQHWMCLSIPFIYIYNGQRGRPIKYAFYLYYPVHVIFLFLLTSL